MTTSKYIRESGSCHLEAFEAHDRCCFQVILWVVIIDAHLQGGADQVSLTLIVVRVECVKLWELFWVGRLDVLQVWEVGLKAADETQKRFGLVKDLGGTEILR